MDRGKIRGFFHPSTLRQLNHRHLKSGHVLFPATNENYAFFVYTLTNLPKKPEKTPPNFKLINFKRCSIRKSRQERRSIFFPSHTPAGRDNSRRLYHHGIKPCFVYSTSDCTNEPGAAELQVATQKQLYQAFCMQCCTGEAFVRRPPGN